MDDRNFHSGNNAAKAKTIVAMIAAVITMFFWGASAACFVVPGAYPTFTPGDGFTFAAIAIVMTIVSNLALRGIK
jgi:hypothetical protein